jgi:hypothetical protein
MLIGNTNLLPLQLISLLMMASTGVSMGRSRLKAVSIHEAIINVHIWIALSKKKVERSLDGQITEIIYKGQHNHEQPTRRAKEGGDINGNINSQAKPDLGLQSQAGNWNNSSERLPAYSVPDGDQESTQAAPSQLPGSSDSEEDGDVETRGEGDDDEPNPKRRHVPN